VLIIFTAAILGILDVLESEQIGTLLAAIAGYVLGRATSRGQEKSSITTEAGLNGKPALDSQNQE
jgi:hypothetical protein